jgi:hypothetical protein
MITSKVSANAGPNFLAEAMNGRIGPGEQFRRTMECNASKNQNHRELRSSPSETPFAFACLGLCGGQSENPKRIPARRRFDDEPDSILPFEDLGTIGLAGKARPRTQDRTRRSWWTLGFPLVLPS